MKRQWHVRREAVVRPDARGRWDQAYQATLRWSLEDERGHEQARAPSANGKEEYYEGGGVRRGLDLSAGQAPDHPKQQLEMVRKHARQQGCELPEEDIFRDDGYSGTTLTRPDLDALRDKVRLRDFEVVMVPSRWLPQELKARQKNLRRGRDALGRQLERLTEAYLGEVIPFAEYQRRRKGLELRDEAMASQEKQLQAQSRQRMELAGVAGSIEDFCDRMRGGLVDATFEQRRRLVELLIDRVIVTGEEVEIRYVIPTDPSSEHVRSCHLLSDYPDSFPGRKVVGP